MYWNLLACSEQAKCILSAPFLSQRILLFNNHYLLKLFKFFLFGIFIEIAICPASLLTSPASPSSTNFLKNLSIPLEMTQNLLKGNCCHMQKSKIDSFISLMQFQNPLENATCLQYQCLT